MLKKCEAYNIMENDRLIIKKKGDDGFRVFSVRLREDLILKIDKIASSSGRSRNEVISLLLEYAAEKCDIV